MKEEKQFHDIIETDNMAALRWQGLLAQGWDRVGTEFFRVRFMNPGGLFFLPMYERMPLRYALANFEFSKSQRKIARINADLRVVYAPARITPEKEDLFNRWSWNRFNQQQTIKTWIGTENPVPMREVRVYKGKKLIACSFFDNTTQAQYSTIGFFDPEESHRSLGTFTMMLEIMHGIAKNKVFHYPGHAFMQEYMYEYKKRFSNAQCFDWQTETWGALPAVSSQPIIKDFLSLIFDEE
jgi:leucyl-tRNA---protein transferase